MKVYEFVPSQESFSQNSEELRAALGNYAIFMSPPWAARFGSETSETSVGAQYIADITGATVIAVNERPVGQSLTTISPQLALVRLMDEAKYQTEAINRHLQPEEGRYTYTVNYGQSLAGSMAAARARIDESDALIMHEPLPSHIVDISLWRGIFEHIGYESGEQEFYRRLDQKAILPKIPVNKTLKDKLKIMRDGLQDTCGTGQRMTAPLLWPILMSAVKRKPQLSIYSEYANLSKALSSRVGIGFAERHSFLEDWFTLLSNMQAKSQDRLYYEQGVDIELGRLAWSVTPHTTHASYDNSEFRATSIKSALIELNT